VALAHYECCVLGTSQENDLRVMIRGEKMYYTKMMFHVGGNDYLFSPLI
jgi:hypothetical protein